MDGLCSPRFRLVHSNNNDDDNDKEVTVCLRNLPSGRVVVMPPAVWVALSLILPGIQFIATQHIKWLVMVAAWAASSTEAKTMMMIVEGV
jgi:hypothetical protein